MEFDEIIKKRLSPGILILNLHNRLLYANNDALDIIPSLRENKVPEQILKFCNQIKNNDLTQEVLYGTSGSPYSLRGFLIGRDRKTKSQTHIMVLIERIIEKHQIDFVKVREDFKFTNRELEVLGHICNGLTNKEISEQLSICEYTVKDHIKNIMRKMNVTSRSGIIAFLHK